MINPKSLDRQKVAILNIENFIAKNNLTQAVFAEMAGLDPGYLNKILKGVKGIGKKNDTRLANAMGLESRYDLYRPPKGLLNPMVEEIWDRVLDLHKQGKDLELIQALLDLLEGDVSPEIERHLINQIKLLKKI